MIIYVKKERECSVLGQWLYMLKYTSGQSDPGEYERGRKVVKRVLCVLLSFAFVAAFCGLLSRFDTTVPVINTTVEKEIWYLK